MKQADWNIQILHKQAYCMCDFLTLGLKMADAYMHIFRLRHDKTKDISEMIFITNKVSLHHRFFSKLLLPL